MKNFVMRLFLFLACHQVCLQASQADYSIVFIHIGPNLPHYIETAISQARLFNKEANIILVANQNAINSELAETLDPQLKIITCESLTLSEEHCKFSRERSGEGFWKYTSERFLYLNDLFAKYDLKNVFHMEYDNMLYVNLDELLPIFQNHYSGVAATFDNDQRCIPGFIFIPNREKMSLLASFFAEVASCGYNDMECIALFKDSHSNSIDYLPIIMTEYGHGHPLRSDFGHTVKDGSRFSNHIELFQSVFDAAAIGQYLGGCDPIHGHKPGFINESCIFNPSFLTYDWQVDLEGRRAPYMIYANKRYRINNLHVHSKRLKHFASVNPGV